MQGLGLPKVASLRAKCMILLRAYFAQSLAKNSLTLREMGV